MKKYKLLKVRKSDGLRRIKYLIDIPEHDIKAGDLGGLLEGYHNLSQEGECAVLDDSIVRERAKVYGNALVHDRTFVSDSASVFHAAIVKNSCVTGNSSVCGSAKVLNGVRLSSFADICGSAVMEGMFQVLGGVRITCGRWTRKPIYIAIDPYNASEDGDGFIRIGCQRRTYEDWMESGLNVSKAVGMKEPDVEKYRMIIEMIDKIRKLA